MENDEQFDENILAKTNVTIFKLYQDVLHLPNDLGTTWSWI